MARAWHHDKPAHERGYGHAWRRLRARILQRDKGLCRTCKKAGRITAADEVDHVNPKSQGGDDNPANLAAICAPCHRAKTAKERHPNSKRLQRNDGWDGGRTGEDGWPIA